ACTLGCHGKSPRCRIPAMTKRRRLRWSLILVILAAFAVWLEPTRVANCDPREINLEENRALAGNWVRRYANGFFGKVLSRLIYNGMTTEQVCGVLGTNYNESSSLFATGMIVSFEYGTYGVTVTFGSRRGGTLGVTDVTTFWPVGAPSRVS